MTGQGERGVTIGGNANVSGQIATGDNVTQNQQINAGPAADLAEALANVERLLEAHTAELAEPGRARRDLADIREEAEAGDDADPERMEGALARLGRRVAGVAVLTEAVRQLAVTAGIG
ncbi:hypothetical protein E1200_28885 [Actinomadura sp. GC306]|uniref:DUF5955 family protein n=1 Tax=Actinomadura sp. GC306 TaxID=2530367 RepID=UPI00104DEC53|nr:DUF5955 family protein [Actinomadura sp. GC306]TDC61431.1 hypothetical protein E1200_28885 [Actinomadura sp. GC306]